jgi:hypothetical protein
MNLKCLTTFSVYSLIEDTMVIYCDAFQFHPVYFIQKSIQLTFMISRSFPIFLMISHFFLSQRQGPLTLCDTFRSPPLQKLKKYITINRTNATTPPSFLSSKLFISSWYSLMICLILSIATASRPCVSSSKTSSSGSS